MYEEKPKRKLKINWKSLIIKMIILLVVLFLVLWLISIVKNNKGKNEVKNDLTFSTNFTIMKDTALDYFTLDKLPTNINGKKKITLEDMVNYNLIDELKGQDNNVCDKKNSYAEATKISTDDYTIKVKLVCGSESNYVIDTITVPSIDSDEIFEDEKDTGNVDIEPDKNVENNSTSTNTSVNTNKNNNTSSNSSSNSNTTKPSTNIGSNNSNNSSTTTKPIITVTTTCKYGKKDYTSEYPLAYVIAGNCAVSKDDYYKAEYANKVSAIGATEYQKLYKEISDLETKTGADLYVESPIYSGVYNKSQNGLVGYQIMFVAKQKYGYTTKVIYQYYLSSNGDRKVVIDNRSSVKAQNNNSNTNNINSSNTNNNSNSTNNTGNNTQNEKVEVKSLTINKTLLSLYEGEDYTLNVSINPSNATNKTVTWKSNNISVATVDQNGKVVAKAKGSAIITATVDGIEATSKVTVLSENTYTYCAISTKTIYSIAYVNASTLDEFSYKIELKDDSIDKITSYTYGNLSNSQYDDAYDYWKNANKGISLVDGVNSDVDPGNYANLMKYSLKNYNFKPTLINKGTYFEIKVNLNNLDNIKDVTAYKINNNYGIYYLPLYIKIDYINNGKCINVKESQVSEYINKGYVKVNGLN